MPKPRGSSSRTPRSPVRVWRRRGTYPDPAESTSDATDTIWTFTPPEGDTLTVSFDARLEPGVQWRREGTTTVEVGAEQVSVSYTTWVWP